MHDSGEGHTWDAQEVHLQMKDRETQESSAPVPKIHQRKQMVQARRTTDLQPHLSPSRTWCNSSIITGPRNPKLAGRSPNPISSPAPPYSPPPPHSKAHLWSATISMSNPPAKTRDHKPLTRPSVDNFISDMFYSYSLTRSNPLFCL